MKFQAISGPVTGGVVRGVLRLGDESPEQECSLGLTDWKGLSALLLSPLYPPCLLSQPLQEQGNTVYLGLSSITPLGPLGPSLHPHIPWSP